MHIGVVTVYVDNQDRAKTFYTEKLGWEVTMDADMGEGGRWLTVAPKGAQTAIVLAQAGGDWGKPAGGNAGIILEVDDVIDFGKQLKNAGVELTEEPRHEPWGGWAMFKDSEGNELGLHSPAQVSATT